VSRSALYEDFLHFARERGFFAPGESVLAAVSGGPDSVAMLDILKRFSRHGRIALFACHLDHELRGRESTRDASFVRTLCRSLGVPLVVAERDVRSLAKRSKLSIEAAARRARYEFFARAARRFGCTKVATAHTLSDNAETILQRLIEGGGPAGLSGIPASRALDEKGKISVVRPLLFAARREIENYLAARGISARIDRTNLAPLYTRNKIRLEILPRILELNPSAEEAISRAGANIASLFEYVEDAVAGARQKIIHFRAPGKTVLKRRALLSAPGVVSRAVVKSAILDSGVDGRAFSSAHVDAVMKLAKSRRPCGTTALPGGVAASVRYGSLTIAGPKAAVRRATAARCKGAPAASPRKNRTFRDGARRPGFCRPLPVPGTVVLPGGSGRIEARIVRRFDLAAFVAAKTRFEEVVDADSIKGNLVVRFPRPGERLRPLGAPGEKKLSDFFTDLKIPLDERGRTPIVADEAGIIWVAGCRISHRVRLASRTKRFLKLGFCAARRKSPQPKSLHG